MNKMSISLKNTNSLGIPLSSKVSTIESSLQECLLNFKELIAGFNQLCIEAETYKTKLSTQREMCERQYCIGSEALKQVVANQNRVIQHIADAVTRLNETKNFSIIDEIFSIICNEASKNVSVTSEIKSYEAKHPALALALTRNTTPKKDVNTILIKKELCSPFKSVTSSFNEHEDPVKKKLSISIGDVSNKDESVSEIEGTPTASGKTSPIIQSKKFKPMNTINTTEVRDKKKCPGEWSTPSKKILKPHPSASPSGARPRLRQARIALVPAKAGRARASFVDLTSSPAFGGGARGDYVQKIIKKESSENDDTILPSPTSGPNCFLLSTGVKDKDKIRRPLSLKAKSENVSSSNVSPDSKEKTPMDIVKMEESINILNSNRFVRPQNPPTLKHEAPDEASMSLLRHHGGDDDKMAASPPKGPLAENINVTNSQTYTMEHSMSLLQNNPHNIGGTEENSPERSKEPACATRKAEEDIVWCCDECKEFLTALHKDDPERAAKIAKAVAGCKQKRRPAVAMGTTNYWNPRWDVPTDTEEFNRRNNAI